LPVVSATGVAPPQAWGKILAAEQADAGREHFWVFSRRMRAAHRGIDCKGSAIIGDVDVVTHMLARMRCVG
jgi:hypothetical protein